MALGVVAFEKTLSLKELKEASVAGDMAANAGNWNAGPVGRPNLGESVCTGLRVPGPQKCMPGIRGVL